MFLNNIDQLRQIEWGRGHLWDIKFDGAPSPFNAWFPAIDIEENLYTLESYTFEGYGTQFKVPYKTTPFQITTIFPDDINNTLSTWLSDWVNLTILGNGTVSPLENSIKLVTIAKIGTIIQATRKTIKINSYWVYPEGELMFHGSSDAEVPTYSATFVVVGVGPEEYTPQEPR